MALLLVASTPIGNLGDVSERFKEAVESADLIACEDTRVFSRLCHSKGIKYPKLVSYHDHNEKDRIDYFLSELGLGLTVLLASSAGTPLISDPGYSIVRAAIEFGIIVSPIPGPCAAVSALSCSGLRVDKFAFAGFPPKKPGKLIKYLTELKTFQGTLIFYESPFRILKLVTAAVEVYGNCRAVIAREITKLHEEFIRMPLADLVSHLTSRNIKGEIVLLIENDKSMHEQD